jgi:SPP1 gp7 family putative phage head morphogenesis protein
MAKSVNEQLTDFQLTQAVFWVRLGNRETKEARKILLSVDSRLADLIREENLTVWSRSRAKAMRSKVRNILDAINDSFGVYMTDLVTGTATLSAEAEALAMQKALGNAGVVFDLVTPNAGVLATAALTTPFEGLPLDEWISKLKRNDVARTWAGIQDGIIAGTKTEDLIRDVVGNRSLNYKNGVREVTRRGAEAMVRTVINHAANIGREALWKANADLIKGVRWLSTLDSRTTPICQLRDGNLYPVGVGPRPPAHPNCRSTTVPITKSWRELGIDVDEISGLTRSSMNGQVPADTTYFDWLSGQTSAIQLEVLGPTRLKLWKQGGIAPKTFINDRGRLLRLDELRLKYPDIFQELFP